MTTKDTKPIKLNIGAGTTKIDGFIPIDRSLGSEAFPLRDYEDGSVQEIRASHILEHFGFAEVQLVLNEWARVLKHGGVIRIAVPDFDLLKTSTDPKVPLYIMGGQTTKNDCHCSLFTKDILGGFMERAGFASIGRWSDPGIDTASSPISLNLCGVKMSDPEPIPGRKPKAGDAILKLCAVMSVPRYGSNEAFACVYQALQPIGIPVHQFTGAFWGQCLTRALESCQRIGIDWALTIDYDSMFTERDVRALIATVIQRPDIDAIAALQARRGKLVAIGDAGGPDMTVTSTNGEPIKVRSAHFGLTLIRISALADLVKPWIQGQPDPSGGWNDGRVDADVAFWRNWQDAGHTCYIAPAVPIGHLEEMVTCFDDKFQIVHRYAKDWRRQAYPHRYGKTGGDRFLDADTPPAESVIDDSLKPSIWADSEGSAA